MAEHQLLGDSDGGGLHSLLPAGDRLALSAVCEHQEHVSVSDALLGPAGQVAVVITLRGRNVNKTKCCMLRQLGMLVNHGKIHRGF